MFLFLIPFLALLVNAQNILPQRNIHTFLRFLTPVAINQNRYKKNLQTKSSQTNMKGLDCAVIPVALMFFWPRQVTVCYPPLISILLKLPRCYPQKIIV
ncbi:hypothetical protein EBQ74_00515 [bacterium]|nr:hypothetical protein [bacterium]